MAKASPEAAEQLRNQVLMLCRGQPGPVSVDVEQLTTIVNRLNQAGVHLREATDMVQDQDVLMHLSATAFWIGTIHAKLAEVLGLTVPAPERR